MKNVLYFLITGLTIILFSSCGKKMTFKEQIEKDFYDKVASGYCENDKISKGSEIKNLQINEITPIGDTGMIDISLEFDVIDSNKTEQHLKKGMLYLEDKESKKKMLAIFCDYDYRKNIAIFKIKVILLINYHHKSILVDSMTIITKNILIIFLNKPHHHWSN